MTIKWKIFAVANYVLLLAFASLIGLLTWSAMENGLTPADLATFIPVIAGSVIILTNSLFNVILFHRFFPNRIPHRKTRILYLIQTVLFILAVAALIVLVTIGFIEETGREQYSRMGLFLLIVFSFLLLLAVYVLVCQFRLKRFLQKNFNKKISIIINTIGSGD